MLTKKGLIIILINKFQNIIFFIFHKYPMLEAILLETLSSTKYEHTSPNGDLNMGFCSLVRNQLILLDSTPVDFQNII